MGYMEFHGEGGLKRVQKFVPGNERYDVVEVSDFFHHIRATKGELTHVVYSEVLAKLCYICSKKLILHVEVENADKLKDFQKGGRFGLQPRLAENGDKTVITPLRLSRELEDCGFEPVLRQIDSKELETVEAQRMSKVVWDGKAPFSSYLNNTIMEMSLDARILRERIWSKAVRREVEAGNFGKIWWRRVDWLVKNFKPWMFLPIVYYQKHGFFTQGIHRLFVARELGMKTVDARIVTFQWWAEYAIRSWGDYAIQLSL